MTILFANNAVATLVTAETSSATTATLSSGEGALFPSPSNGDYFVGTWNDAATGLLTEIVHVTAVSGDIITMVRAQEGTTAQAWGVGDFFSNFMTAGEAAAMAQVQVYAGNPNGNVEGTAGAPSLSPSIVWDTIHEYWWVCTVGGSKTSAVWIVASDLFGFGVATGSTNAWSVSIPGITLADGLCIRVRFGATNSIDNPTLNLNATGNATIYFSDGVSNLSLQTLPLNAILQYTEATTSWALLNPVKAVQTWTLVGSVNPYGSATATVANIPQIYADLLLVFDSMSVTTNDITGNVSVLFSTDNGSTWTAGSPSGPVVTIASPGGCGSMLVTTYASPIGMAIYAQDGLGGQSYSLTGSIAGTVLTVTVAPTGGVLVNDNDFLSGAGVTPGSQILSQASGSPGGIGTYNLNLASTVAGGTAMAISLPNSATVPDPSTGFNTSISFMRHVPGINAVQLSCNVGGVLFNSGQFLVYAR